MGHDFFSLTILGILLVVTNVYWMYHSQKLVNKLMSRDFTEFRLAETKEPVKRDKRQASKSNESPEDFGVLQGIGL